MRIIINHDSVKQKIKREEMKMLVKTIKEYGRKNNIKVIHKKMSYNPNDFFINFHMENLRKHKNICIVKNSYLRDYIYMDRVGFSGSSEVTTDDDFINKLNLIDTDEATKCLTKLKKKYISKRITKYKQTNVKFTCKKPYIFLPGQCRKDVVAKFAWIDTLTLMKSVIKCFKKSDYKVVIKIHPKDNENAADYNFLKKSGCILTKASIYDIIPSAVAVYTVNSGVGFESLMMGKNVFISGLCEYHWVANKVKTRLDIENSIKNINMEPDLNLIAKFMYYMCNDYFINTKKPKNIENRLAQLIEEFECE